MTRPLEFAPTTVDLVNRMCEAAYELAVRWDLVQQDGSVRCMRAGCTETASLPTLLCRQHQASRRRAQ